MLPSRLVALARRRRSFWGVPRRRRDAVDAKPTGWPGLYEAAPTLPLLPLNTEHALDAIDAGEQWAEGFQKKGRTPRWHVGSKVGSTVGA